jgi:hypothetical protein
VLSGIIFVSLPFKSDAISCSVMLSLQTKGKEKDKEAYGLVTDQGVAITKGGSRLKTLRTINGVGKG